MYIKVDSAYNNNVEYRYKSRNAFYGIVLSAIL